ncbi:pentapeptide repeat-containing protein [Streptomyces sp. Tue6028]|uniref:pentapeptide repeat-containing protein n=1 Tax=Streptomyces sp. Tue6028 TaxID=2036037 RepID=UPI003D73D137
MTPAPFAAESATRHLPFFGLIAASTVLAAVLCTSYLVRTAPAPDTDEKRAQRARWQGVQAAVGGITSTIIFVLLFWRGPWWFDNEHIRSTDLQPADGVVITGFRTGLVALAAGLVAGAGLYYTHKKHQLEREQFQHAQDQFAESQKQFETTLREAQARDAQQAELAREGQVTDRYVEAIKLLGSRNLTQRLGGIHSLGRIMNDSRRDRWPIAEVLTAFVRSRAPRLPDPQPPKPQLDVQAALSVIGRNPLIYQKLDLSMSDLRGYRLHELNFICIDFDESDLSGSRLGGASLKRCTFRNATLHAVQLFQADLYGTNFTGADLTGADLAWAEMPRTTLTDAVLEEAELSHVNAASSRGWGHGQVDSCRHDDTTKFPPEIADWLQTRAEEEARASQQAPLPSPAKPDGS